MIETSIRPPIKKLLKRSKKVLSSKEILIIDYLYKNNPARLSDISNALKMNKATILYNLNKLVKKGLVEKNGDYYTLSTTLREIIKREKMLRLFLIVLVSSISTVSIISSLIYSSIIPLLLSNAFITSLFVSLLIYELLCG